MHQRTLRTTYTYRNPTLDQLLKSDKIVYIHHTNLPVLVTKMFMISNNLSQDILTAIFT